MLQFFRRFQKAIFIAMTVVIIASFSFFGTYSAVTKPVQDVEVFKAVDGTAVKRSEVDALANFLSSDALDQHNWGIPLGANFLNDGVVRNDFLKKGLGKALFEAYYDDLKEEWDGKWKREKGFQAYRHPEVAYFSADMVWSHFAPELKGAFKSYKAGFETAAEHFEKKAHLYLAEGDFSEQKLRQVLYYQMQQAKWIKPDNNLAQQNLSLFGYRTLNDWFGHDFLRLTASFILNAAKVAERKGYSVTADEALFDLKKKAVVAFESQKQNPLMTAGDPSQYLREQLRYLGMDLGQAAEVWQKVLLFRKLFNDLGSAVVVDKATFEPMVDFAGRQVDVVTYQLPQEAEIKDFRQFQRLHTYLKKAGKEFGSTAVPVQWFGANEVDEALLLKNYLVDMKEVDYRNMSQNITLKSMWDWQVSDKGWEKLTSHFSALVDADTVEGRFASLDNLDDFTKEMVDQKSKAYMAEEHPEWIEEALASAPSQKKTLTFYKKMSKTLIKGLNQPEKAVALLDAPELDAENPPVVILRDVGDKVWQVTIYDRSPAWEVATFAEAERDGVLEEMAVAFLQEGYADEKPFNEVRDQIAQDMFRRELNRTKRSMPDMNMQSVDLISTYALYDYVNGLKSGEEATFLRPSRMALEDQFKLVKEETTWDRSQNSLGVSFDAILAIEPNQMSQVIHKPNGELFFYRVSGSKVYDQETILHEMMVKSQEDLSSAIQIELAQELLLEFKEKEAMKLTAFKGDKGSRAV